MKKSTETGAKLRIAKVKHIVKKAKVIKKNPDPLQLKQLTFAIILIVTGAIGIFTSLTLTIDKIHVLKDPSYVPNCNINPIFSCKSVMGSSQAEIAGIPNTVFGLIGFSMVAMTGITLLAGAHLHRRFWQLWSLGMIGGFGFMVYLMYQSIYRLGTLCLYCMATWAVLIPLIWYSFLWVVENEYVRTPKKWEAFINVLRKDHVSFLIIPYVIVIALIVQHFWYYFKTI